MKILRSIVLLFAMVSMNAGLFASVESDAKNCLIAMNKYLNTGAEKVARQSNPAAWASKFAVPTNQNDINALNRLDEQQFASVSLKVKLSALLHYLYGIIGNVRRDFGNDQILGNAMVRIKRLFASRLYNSIIQSIGSSSRPRIEGALDQIARSFGVFEGSRPRAAAIMQRQMAPQRRPMRAPAQGGMSAAQVHQLRAGLETGKKTQEEDFRRRLEEMQRGHTEQLARLVDEAERRRNEGLEDLRRQIGEQDRELAQARARAEQGAGFGRDLSDLRRQLALKDSQLAEARVRAQEGEGFSRDLGDARSRLEDLLKERDDLKKRLMVQRSGAGDAAKTAEDQMEQLRSQLEAALSEKDELEGRFSARQKGAEGEAHSAQEAIAALRAKVALLEEGGSDAEQRLLGVTKELEAARGLGLQSGAKVSELEEALRKLRGDKRSLSERLAAMRAEQEREKQKYESDLKTVRERFHASVVARDNAEEQLREANKGRGESDTRVATLMKRIAELELLLKKMTGGWETTKALSERMGRAKDEAEAKNAALKKTLAEALDSVEGERGGAELARDELFEVRAQRDAEIAKHRKFVASSSMMLRRHNAETQQTIDALKEEVKELRAMIKDLRRRGRKGRPPESKKVAWERAVNKVIPLTGSRAERENQRRLRDQLKSWVKGLGPGVGGNLDMLNIEKARVRGLKRLLDEHGIEYFESDEQLGHYKSPRKQ